MNKQFDYIVIGVGSMGSSTCYHLAKSGATVLGIEQFELVHERGAHSGQSRIVRKAYFEHPDYIRAEALTPDYYHYITNQLIKPISQIYALCVEKLPGYTYPPSYWEQMDIEMSDQKMYTDEKKRKKRIQALKQREVEDLLFSKYLDILKPNRNVRAYKKRHVLDLDKNKTIDETKDQYVLTINCDKVTKEKPAKDKTKDKVVVKNTETTKGAVWKLTLVLTNSTQQTEIFKEDFI